MLKLQKSYKEKNRRNKQYEDMLQVEVGGKPTGGNYFDNYFE